MVALGTLYPVEAEKYDFNLSKLYRLSRVQQVVGGGLITEQCSYKRALTYNATINRQYVVRRYSSQEMYVNRQRLHNHRSRL